MKEYNPNYLDFVQPLLEIEAKIKQLKNDPDRTAKSEAAVIKLEKDYVDKTNNKLKFNQILCISFHKNHCETF